MSSAFPQPASPGRPGKLQNLGLLADHRVIECFEADSQINTEIVEKNCTKGLPRHKIAFSDPGIAGETVVWATYAAVLALRTFALTEVLNLTVKGVYRCPCVYEFFC